MASRRVSGTQGYAAEAEALFKQYENIPFAEFQSPILHLIPTAPSRVLDIGSGTGRDAGGLAALGHEVVAVEPTDELRRRAAAAHPSPRIEWLDDSLPDLTHLTARGARFDVVLMTAVWMHLDEPQRRRAMPRVAERLRGGGVLLLSLRHGPVPPGRRMFEVSSTETIALAAAQGLGLVLRQENQDGYLKRPGVTWTRLAFSKQAG